MDIVELKKINRVKFNRHPWEKVRFDILLFFLSKSAKLQKIIVDIGSGDGFIAKKLATKFSESEIFAVDINYNSLLLDIIAEPGLKNVHFLNSFEVSKFEAKADVVLLLDVLEHIEKPVPFLINLKAVPKKECTIIITVPAFQFLFSDHDKLLGHYKRYNRIELSNLISNSGFRIIQSGYIFPTLLLIRIFQRIFRKKFKGDGIHNWKGGLALTYFLKKLLWIEFKICWYLSRLNINIPGLTSYCICQPLP